MSKLFGEDDELSEDQKEAEGVFQSFLERHHQEGIQCILIATQAEEHYSITVNALEFFDANMHIGQILLKNPMIFLPIFDEALRKSQLTVLDSMALSSVTAEMTVKQNTHVRLSNLPVCPELTRVNVPKSEDVGSFIAISGMILNIIMTCALQSPSEGPWLRVSK